VILSHPSFCPSHFRTPWVRSCQSYHHHAKGSPGLLSTQTTLQCAGFVDLESCLILTAIVLQLFPTGFRSVAQWGFPSHTPAGGVKNIYLWPNKCNTLGLDIPLSFAYAGSFNSKSKVCRRKVIRGPETMEHGLLALKGKNVTVCQASSCQNKRSGRVQGGFQWMECQWDPGQRSAWTSAYSCAVKDTIFLSDKQTLFANLSLSLDLKVAWTFV
jgi:hypothetical protein